MAQSHRIMTKDQLEEHRLEIENRIRNLFWTISGDYSLQIQPDVETFAHSQALALYDAIKQGAFAKHFDTQALALYALKKCAQGAEETLLMELVQLCVDAAVYPKLTAERSGVAEIRRRAFRDFLETDRPPESRQAGAQTLFWLRQSLMCRFLGEPDPCPEALRPGVQQIEALSQQPDTQGVIAGIDELYNSLLDPDFAQKRGSLQEVLGISLPELLEYERSVAISDAQIDSVLDTFLKTLKRDMLRMKVRQAPPPQRIASQAPMDDGEPPAEPDPQSTEKVLAYLERNFGQSYLTPLERERLERRLCKGIHARCSLYFTEGILQAPALKNTQYLRGRMQLTKNELYFRGKQRAVRRSVTVLANMLKLAQTMRLDENYSRSDTGRINPSRMWKPGRSGDTKLFDRKQPVENTSFVVDLLLDSSGSQNRRQPQVATQGYIISQALSEAGIPHRVNSFCSFWDYTIFHRFRDFDDPAEHNLRILQFHALGENRDGLAIRTVCDSLMERREDNKILIILSDGRPNDLSIGRPGSRKPAAYVGETAIKDTAFEVRRARNMGIAVLGIFAGSEEDLYAEKKIFGKEFAYTKNISSFSHIVGTYLRKQMELE